MKLHFAGNFKGDESILPKREHPDGYVQFKEPNVKLFFILMNIFAVVIFLVLYIIVNLRAVEKDSNMLILGAILAIVTMIPHEFLHAVFFRSDVYVYTYAKCLSMFVACTEDVSKVRFIIMGLCPNIIFGAIPYILFMINPQWYVLGVMGAIAISMGAGDYVNVINALTQVPKGAMTYMHGAHTYWYMPKKGE